MKRLAVLLAAAITLTGCSAASDLTPEPDEAEKAWHNCMTVLDASPTPKTDDGITSQTICENQRSTWQDFDTKWVVEVDRLIDFYDVAREDVSVYKS